MGASSLVETQEQIQEEELWCGSPTWGEGQEGFREVVLMYE